MPRRPLRFRSSIATAALAVATLLPLNFLRAAEEKSVSASDRVRERVLRMTEFFDTMLPGVLEEHNMTLHFQPKFSDVRDYEYIRFPLELRYGLTDRWELRGGLVPFIPNPFDEGRDHRFGPGEVRLGTRYNVGSVLNFFNETTVGIETRVPIGRPPIELNDHYTHVKPFISAARQLLMWPSTTFYLNLAYDRSVDLTHRAPPPIGVDRRNIVEVAPGLLFKPSEVGYFSEYRFRHIRDDYGWHLEHEVQFGVIWDVPLARTEQWHLPGKWQLEFGYKVNHEEGRDTHHGIAARVNWRTTLREVLERTKAPLLWW
jgi:hypothetical protein